MTKFAVYDATGTKTGEKEASAKLFAASVNKDLMHSAVVRQLSNKRKNIAHAITRGEVTATRKKAFKQKGTGNARRGSLTTNLLRGGGAVHGPRAVRNFVKKMTAKQKQQVIRGSLTSRAEVSVVLDLGKIEVPKTSLVVGVLPKLPELKEGKKILFVIASPTQKNIIKSLRNISKTRFVYAQYINPVDFLWSDRVVFVNDALEAVETLFNTSK